MTAPRGRPRKSARAPGLQPPGLPRPSRAPRAAVSARPPAPSRQKPGTFGDRIREARQRAGVGLRALAAELRITPSYLSDIENAKSPSPQAPGGDRPEAVPGPGRASGSRRASDTCAGWPRRYACSAGSRASAWARRTSRPWNGRWSAWQGAHSPGYRGAGAVPGPRKPSVCPDPPSLSRLRPRRKSQSRSSLLWTPPGERALGVSLPGITAGSPPPRAARCRPPKASRAQHKQAGARSYPAALMVQPIPAVMCEQVILQGSSRTRAQATV